MKTLPLAVEREHPPSGVVSRLLIITQKTHNVNRKSTIFYSNRKTLGECYIAISCVLVLVTQNSRKLVHNYTFP